MKFYDNIKFDDGIFGKADNDAEPKVYESPQLFGNNKEIQINHKGELYRIRITRNGKLIMNK